MQDRVHFVLCHKQRNKIEGVVLNRVCIVGSFCPVGSGFQTLSVSRIPKYWSSTLPPPPPPPPRATKSNSDLQKFQDWRLENQCPLNPDKTKLLLFGSSQMSANVNEFHLSLVGKRLMTPSHFWTVTSM